MKKTFFELMKLESDSYYSLESIEKQVDSSSSLQNVPIQPLYSVLKKMDTSSLAEVIPRLSQEQQYVLQHLDLWDKDDLKPDSFSDWICAYHECLNEQERIRFVKSSSFLLYLKSVFNIWTFDVEDPLYPEHDYYFLTEDSLLLFEYHEEYPYVDEIKSLVKDLYSELGVEKAYAHLFKIISEEYLSFLEDEYDFKKKTLNDYGLIDYYDALEKVSPYPNSQIMDVRIKQAKGVTPQIESLSAHQNLPNSIMNSLTEGAGALSTEALSVQSEGRIKYLRFDFIQLINSVLTIDQSLSKGSVAIKKSCQEIETLCELGLDYLKNSLSSKQDSLFDKYSMSDCYKIGVTLVGLIHKKMKQVLTSLGAFQIDSRFGDFIYNFFDHYQKGEEKYYNFRDQSEVKIHSFEIYQNLEADLMLFLKLVELAAPLLASFNQIKESGSLNDHLYLNYKVEDIDFESLFLSMFANHVLNIPKQSKKLGLTPKEFRKFIKLKQTEKNFDSEISSFLSAMNFEQSKDFVEYIQALVDYHLEGYDFSSIEDGELRYVGGVIILNSLN